MSVAAVLATLLGAVIAYVQSEAIKTSTGAGVEAQSLGVQAVEARATASDAAELQYSRFLLLDAERRQLGNAWQAYLQGDHTTRLEIARLELVTSQTIAVTNALAAGQSDVLGPKGPTAATGSVLDRRLCPITPPDARPPPGCAAGDFGPDQDLAFPRRYFADASRNAERLTAQRDAALARSSEREGQSVAYTITLSMFGVAIFLFGFTLTPQGRKRARLFSTTAAGLVVFALAYAAYDGLQIRDHAHDGAAASHYAGGVVAFGRGDYATAARELSATIALRPDFARPYYQRALAALARDAPVVSRDNPFSLVPLATLRAAIRDLRSAAANGLGLADATNRLAGALAQLGVRTRDRGMLAESAALAQQTARVSPGDATPQLVRGLDELALGRPREAEAAYRAAAGLIARTTASRLSEQLIAGALTGLDLLAAQAGSRAATSTQALKDLVAAPRHLGAAARIGAVGIRVNPGGVTVTITGQTGLRPGGGQVAAQWYYDDPAAGGWSVVPAISGPLGLAQPIPGGYEDTRSFLASSIKGAASGCLPPGRYRLELYVDGRLAWRGASQLGGPSLTPVFNREMNVAACLPGDWRRTTRIPGVPFRLDATPALIAGWTSPDHTEGVLFTRLNGQFRAGQARGLEPRSAAAQVAVKAIRLWARAFPPRLRASPYWTPASLPIGFSRNQGVRRTFSYSGGAPPASGGGVVRAEGQFNNNDLAVVIAAWGPRPAAALSQTILGSVTAALS